MKAAFGILALGSLFLTVFLVTSPSLGDGQDSFFELVGNPIFQHPEEVAAANPYLAPDATVRAMYTTIDSTRDDFEQLKGSLTAHRADEDCDGIHTLARKVKEAHSKYELLDIQYKELDKDSRQDVSIYMQHKLSDIVHAVTTGLVKELINCERSSHLYAQSVGGIRMIAAKLDMYTKRLQKNSKDCVALQNIFHEATEEIEIFHVKSKEDLNTMREKNMIVAADQAFLETTSKVHPAEHLFFVTYDRLWDRECKEKADALFNGEEGGKDGGKEGGSSSGSGSGSGSASSSGSSSA